MFLETLTGWSQRNAIQMTYILNIKSMCETGKPNQAQWLSGQRLGTELARLRVRVSQLNGVEKYLPYEHLRMTLSPR